MQNTEKELKKYISQSWTAYIGLAFFGLLFLIGLVSSARGNSSALPALLIFGIFAALASISPIRSIRGISEFLEGARSRNELDAVLLDFETAQSLCGDKIRMGEKYIYGKKTGGIYDYNQIRKVYQYIHKTNFAEDRRELRAETIDGKTKTLCRLALKGKDDENMKQIVMRIFAKNPTVKIGYRS